MAAPAALPRRSPGAQGALRAIAPRLVLGLYILFLLVPIYWLVNMSFKTNLEISSSMTLWPQQPTLENYRRIFTDSSWYSGYINSLNFVILNMAISLSVALPAAYAFSRYRFLGDKHLFFWLLSNRMAPPAVFALPFFQLYSAVGLFDTPWAVALAHCVFNIPLAVWILEGFMSGVPREIDETAAIDGWSFPAFFVRIFMPMVAGGIGVAAFFCFMFSWVELLLARTLTTVNAKPIVATMTRTVSAAGMDWGLLAAAGVLTIIPGTSSSGSSATTSRAASRWGGSDGGGKVGGKYPPHPLSIFVGAAPAHWRDGGCFPADLLRTRWMAWTWQTGLLFVVLRHPGGDDGAGGAAAEVDRIGMLGLPTTRGDRLFLTLLGAAFIHLGWLALAGEARSGAPASCP